ncbi:hypothetical protein PIB30_044075 [Stylosanthes scabra]|uniref:BRO1 domain-containing protein n=1 Tax=Stylosanthes scabra TaxID=79078 RepID=A0ABU6XEI4_9FABA|nr:hypothetical protein [Stylosanthes scabra]
MANTNTNVVPINPNPNPAKMLAIPVKKTDPVELYLPLRNLVAKKYSETDAQKVESILETLNKCRMDMVERREELSLSMHRDCLIHYFKCLCMVEPLFTAISSDSDPIIFFWYDAFESDYICVDRVSSKHNNIHLEKAAILFNLGAIYSQIGASCDTTTALGRHLAIDAFKIAANIFLKLWKDFAQLTSVSKLYRKAYDLILSDSAATQHVYSFDGTWVTHLHQKEKFFRVEALQRASIKRPRTFSYGPHGPFLPDEESVTENLVEGICIHSGPWIPKQGLIYHDMWIPKQQLIYLDLILSEYSPFKIVDGGKLVANPWDMPPPYPTNLAILWSSSSSHILPIPLKKSEPLNLYEPLRSYYVLKCSESVAKKVEDLLETLSKLRFEMQREDLSLPARRDCLISYFKCLCMIESVFPMMATENPLTFVWYDAFNPQEKDSRDNIINRTNSIYLEKASVLFNLGALCTHIAASCDITTIQGYGVAIDALNEASHWFQSVSQTLHTATTTDLSFECVKMLLEIISAQISDTKLNFPHSQSDRLSLPEYPVSVLYRKAYDMSSSRTLTVKLAQSTIPQYLESKMKMKTCIVETGPGDVTAKFISGYFKAKSLLSEGCQRPCLDLLSEVSPVKIKDGNLVASKTLEALRLSSKEMSLQETSNMIIDKN